MSVRMQSLWRNDEGSALIEGAILVPVLLVLVLGVLEFSWLIDQQHLISTGIHDAARYLARSANPNDVTIQKDAKNLATTGAIDGRWAPHCGGRSPPPWRGPPWARSCVSRPTRC